MAKAGSRLPPWGPPDETETSQSGPHQCVSLEKQLLAMKRDSDINLRLILGITGARGLGARGGVMIKFMYQLDWAREPGEPDGAVIKNPPAKAGDTRDADSIPRLGRSPGGGNGNLSQNSSLENSMDRGAWGL